jgi:hypothetical protein
MEENHSILSDFAVLIFLGLLFVSWCTWDWFKLRFNGFKSKKIFCLHRKEHREYSRYQSIGIFGSEFREFRCKNCNRTLRTRKGLLNKKEEIAY